MHILKAFGLVDLLGWGLGGQLEMITTRKVRAVNKEGVIQSV